MKTENALPALALQGKHVKIMLPRSTAQVECHVAAAVADSLGGVILTLSKNEQGLDQLRVDVNDANPIDDRGTFAAVKSGDVRAEDALDAYLLREGVVS